VAFVLFYQRRFFRAGTNGVKPVSSVHGSEDLVKRPARIGFIRVVPSTDRNNVRVGCRLIERFLFGADNSIIGHNLFAPVVRRLIRRLETDSFLPCF
jgi:hypothetical protein